MFVIDIRNPLWGIFSWLGGVDIAPHQYERNIAFYFGESANILEAEVVGENPPDLDAKLLARFYPPYYFFPDNKVVLKPTLLN